MQELGILVRRIPEQLNRSFRYIVLAPLNKDLYNRAGSLIQGLNEGSKSCNLISDQCVISENCKIGTNVMVAPLAYIGPFTKVSEGCVLRLELLLHTTAL